MSRTERRRSIRLRLALAVGALGAATAGLALGGLYLGTDLLLEREVDAGIRREAAELVARYRSGGRAGLAVEIGRRSTGVAGRRGVYLLAESHYAKIEGNLPAWPAGLSGEASGRELDLRELALEEGAGSQRFVRHVRMTALTLADGARLGVGRDVTESRRLEDTLGVVCAGAFALAVVIAIAGGLAVSHGLLRRVEGMNRTILRILGGGAGERVPVSPRRDEFDDLAAAFNRLLDENDRLVAKMREVSNDIAHDLRTPLSRMRGHIEAALAAPADAERSHETLHALLAETNGVLETFNALLRLSQIEGRSVREQMESLDLASVARDAIDLYQPLAEEAGIVLEEALTPDLGVVANRHLLSQALTNLIDNAIKYGAGAVTVATRRAEGSVLLSVRDRGPGIPAADRERVLERFVRLDASRRRAGTGLGLSFVKAVAELHGAALLLEDADPGLCVTLRFGSPAIRSA